MFRGIIVYFKIITLGSIASAVILSCHSTTGQQMASEAADPIVITAGVDTYFTLVDSAEYADYKYDAELKLKENELLIAGMKDKLNSGRGESPQVYMKELDSINIQNLNLRNIMTTYNEEGRIKWESFKLHFKRKLDAIGKSIYLLDQRI